MDNTLREHGGLPQEYDPGSKLFTVKVFHGGVIKIIEDDFEYDGGEVDFFDKCDPDLMSMIELKDFGERLGYEETMGNVLFFYKAAGGGQYGPFEPLRFDRDVMKIVAAIEESKVLDVYVVLQQKALSTDETDKCVETIHIDSESDDGDGESDTDEDSDDGDGDSDEGSGSDERSGEKGTGRDEKTSDEDSGSDDEHSGYEDNENDEKSREEENEEEKKTDNSHPEVSPQTQTEIPNTETQHEEDVLFDSDYEQHEDAAVDDCSKKGKNVIEDESERELSADELMSSCESDSGIDEERKKKTRFNEFNPNTDMCPKFSIGMKFPTVESFREAVRQYGILEKRAVMFKVNDKRRVRVICKDPCQWFVYASTSKNKPGFQVKTMRDEHTCQLQLAKTYVNAKWLAKKYEGNWEVDNEWKKAAFDFEVRKDTGLEIKRWKYYRAKRKALIKIRGATTQQYSILWDYCDELRRTNPGSTVKMKLSDERGKPYFMRLYVCLAACKKGWTEGCRPIIGLDGCHLKGYHQGQLLTAVGIDADNAIYPIAYAAVESECGETWGWFLQYLREDLEIHDPKRITWISDKQKGLIDVLKIDFHGSDHRHCVRHLYNNFRLEYKRLLLKQILWAAARSTTKINYIAEMHKMKAVNKDAHNWLLNKDPKNWSRSHFSTQPVCDILLNNLCESFNSCILNARDKPIITMLEMIKKYIRRRLVSRKEMADKWSTDVGPRVLKVINKNIKASTYCSVEFCGDMKFEVSGYNGNPYVVDLQLRTCGCYRWNLIRIPCPHAVACINNRLLQVTDFVHDCYKKEAYMKAYSPTIGPMSGPDTWPKAKGRPPIPPQSKTPPGRPKNKKRRKEPT